MAKDIILFESKFNISIKTTYIYSYYSKQASYATFLAKIDFRFNLIANSYFSKFSPDPCSRSMLQIRFLLYNQLYPPPYQPLAENNPP